MNFSKFLRTSFLQNTSGRLLLDLTLTDNRLLLNSINIGCGVANSIVVLNDEIKLSMKLSLNSAKIEEKYCFNWEAQLVYLFLETFKVSTSSSSFVW